MSVTVFLMLGIMEVLMLHQMGKSNKLNQTEKSLVMRDTWKYKIKLIMKEIIIGHSITDVQVRGMRLCRGSNILRKQLEMRPIFQLGTVQPDGLNNNFKYV